ncbi:hypothetical protein FQN53_002006 [Emmonsiellopsis sp. PD_33]|nr:hypothetical protein FQN53_002006 [Emmonsiellopsis sp. PD_33]
MGSKRAGDDWLPFDEGNPRMNLRHICAIVDAPRGALTVPLSRLQQFPVNALSKQHAVILADQMGLGKTIEALGTVYYRSLTRKEASLGRWKDYGPGEDRWYPEHALENVIKELVYGYEETQKESLAHGADAGRQRRGRKYKESTN